MTVCVRAHCTMKQALGMSSSSLYVALSRPARRLVASSLQATANEPRLRGPAKAFGKGRLSSHKT
jgi:hypothetical protein